MKSKRILCLLLSLIMILSAAPGSVFASDTVQGVNVNFTAQADGKFLCAPQLGVSVSSDTAEKYGFKDSVTDGVSALDALVKLHEVLYGESFTQANASDYLAADDYGYISKLFEVETTANGFVYNGGYPNDGTESPWGGYNGTTVTTQKLSDGDTVEFFMYQDTVGWSDELSWFNYKGNDVTEITAAPNAPLKLNLKTFSYMMAYEFIDADAIHAVGSAVSGAQLVWADAETGILTDISSAVTDTSGNVSITVPEAEGTYYITAYIPDKTEGEPLIMSLTKIIVSADAPQADPCALSSLSIASFDSNPDALELTPGFSSDITEYSVPVVAFPSMDLGVFRSVYVKAAAESDEAVITAECNGVSSDITSGDSTWKMLNGALTGGKNNILKITVAALNDEKREYFVTVPMKPKTNTPPEALKETDAVSIAMGGTYSIDLSEIFTDADEVDTITYKVSVNDAEAVAAEKNYSFTPDKTGVYKLLFTANDGSADSNSYTVTIDCEYPDAAISVPSGSSLYVGAKGTKHFVSFTEMEPCSIINNENEDVYYFELEDNKVYNYRVTGDEHITYAGKFKKTADFRLDITEEKLSTDGKTKKSIDRDTSSNNGYNVADIYLNINPEGYLKLDENDTYQLVNLRNWEVVNNTVENYFIEPDYHYTVLDENGNEGSDAIAIDENGLITAQRKGVAIVLVSYDAMNIDFGSGAQFYGAIWPENTGVFVVEVGAGDSGISSGIKINEGKNSSESKLSGDALDSEHDCIYFTGETGSFTFMPETEDVDAYVANPEVSEALTFNGFSPVSQNSDGSFTVPLKNGRNIVKLTKDGKALYQVITAKKVSVSVNNGEPVNPGDVLNISFDKLYHPANKLAGVYNMNAQAIFTNVSGYEGEIVGGLSTQHNFADDEKCQSIAGVLKEKDTWGVISYVKDTELTVPGDYEYDTFTLSGGTFYVSGYGDPYGNHRGITLTDGKAPSVNASVKTAFLGQLPDIVIPITAPEGVLEGISVNDEGVKKDYFAGDSFDTGSLIVTAEYDSGKTQIVSNYTITPEVLSEDTETVTVSYRGKTAEINISVKRPEVISLNVKSMPSKTVYKAGEAFDPTGMVITAWYSNGVSKEITEYSYAPNRTLSTDDTEMTVTYTGDDKAEGLLPVSVPITVSGSSGGSGSGSDNIKVYFTLYGDDKHGEPAGDDETHTMKSGNLKVWLARKDVTVAKGSFVIDAVTKALSIAGIPYVNPDGSYISSIKGLKEFDNGSNSGWMYTLNGKYPDVGVGEQKLSNGDEIVFHYTDDYTAEKNASGGSSSSGSGGGGSSSSEYVVKFETFGGTVIKSLSVKKNDAAIKPEDPKKDGYVFGGWYTDKELSEEYEFGAKVTKSFTLYAKWIEANKENNKKLTAFSDVESGSWYEEVVAFVTEKNLFNGVSESEFAPEDTMTRAMLATVLYRLENPEKKERKNSFSDVAESEWYAEAVAWAAESGIVNGVSDTEFAPEDNITREQIAVILYRYARMRYYNDEAVSEAFEFSDMDEISDYALEAVKWANGAKLINGVSETSISPKTNATRAQVAVILMRFCENIVK